MPDRDPVAGQNSRLLRGLLWAGVVLAPLAAAVVLLGASSGSVRFAVLLMAVSVVLIGASVLIRSDPVLHRMDVEERVAEQVAALKRELRAEFAGGAGAGGGSGPVRGALRGGPPPPVMAQPPVEGSGFFQDDFRPEDDPFAREPEPMGAPMGGPHMGGQMSAPRMGPPMEVPPMGGPQVGGQMGGPRMGPPMEAPQMGGPPVGAGQMGGRASVPVAAASASVRPAPPSQPVAPRQRGAASIPPPPPTPPVPASAPPRAAAAVRPGTEYGRPEAPAADFGYAEQSGEVYGNTYGGATTYGAGNDEYAQDSGYDNDAYGRSGDIYGQNGELYDSGGYPEADGYGYAGPAKPVSGDPNYRARRHRPSANDTNIGSLEDFAEYGGYTVEPQPQEPDERYVQGYGGPRSRY
jgi:hypothetical protein